jgi:hypothetical protein
VPFRASGAGRDVSWTINGRGGIGQAVAAMAAQRGSHVAIVRDAAGHTTEVSFTVK